MATKTLTNSGWACIDCVDVIANGWENFSNNYPDGYSETNAKREDIEKGLSNGRWTYIGDETLDATFSSAQCSCCRSMFAGSRHLVEVEIIRP